MKHGSANLFHFVRLIAIAVTCCVGAAHADEYSDINKLMRAGKLAEAQVRVDRAVAAKPRDVQLRFLKGVIQRDSGRPEEAIATFTQLTEEHPELPEPYNNLAVIYASQSQFDKARAALEMAIRTNPSYATAHENLGDVYAKLASQAYTKALQFDAGNASVKSKLAVLRGQPCQ
jgi:Flp pilus assembly protein TadD